MAPLTDAIKESLKAKKLIAVIRASSKEDALKKVNDAVEKGIVCLEITYTTPDASEIIRTLVQNKDLIVGAGTVTNVEQAKEAVAAGSQFVVSPGFSVELARFFNTTEVLYVPGVVTPSEIMAAKAEGYRLLKLFPSGSFGISYMKNLMGPFPEIQFVPTGGIHPTEVGQWLAAGAVAVGVGSQLAEWSKEQTEALQQT